MGSVHEYLALLNEVDRIESKFKECVDEVSLGEYRVLALVAEDALCLKSISGTRSVAAQGVGKLCERLRKRKLVKVEQDARDKRAKRVTITANGNELAQFCTEELDKILVEEKWKKKKRR